MSLEKVAIIIPIYNLWEKMTVPCLQALAKETVQGEILEECTTQINYHIYLIDNASSDVDPQSATAFGELLFGEHFTYHRFEKNYGFAIACNKGAKLAAKNRDNFIFLLNNDTIVTKNWLPPLIKAFEDTTLGACGPLLLFPSTENMIDRVQHVGVSQNPLGESEHIYLNFPYNHPLVHKKRFLNYITGAAFLIRSKVFFKLGLLCEEYINGFEDLDLCSRLRENGYRLRVIPESVIYHHESQTIGRSDKDNENAKVYTERNKKLPYDDAIIMKEDGYIPSLTKELQYYVAISEEKAKALSEEIHALPTFNPSLCEKFLEKEPLWIEGYHLLADYYEANHRIAEGIYLRELAVNFAPKIENYMKVILSCVKHKNPQHAEYIKQVMERIIAKAKEAKYQDFVENRFQMLASRDKIFQEIYESRLKDV